MTPSVERACQLGKLALYPTHGVLLVTALLAYLRQPTSIAGISAIAGMMFGVISGNTSWQTALPVIAGAIVAIVMPENPAAKAAAATLVTDAIAAQRALVPGEANLTIISSNTHAV